MMFKQPSLLLRNRQPPLHLFRTLPTPYTKYCFMLPAPSSSVFCRWFHILALLFHLLCPAGLYRITHSSKWVANIDRIRNLVTDKRLCRFKWVNLGYTMDQRMAYLEKHWAFFLGFGIPLTTLTFFLSSLRSAAVYAVFFPCVSVFNSVALAKTISLLVSFMSSLSSWLPQPLYYHQQMYIRTLSLPETLLS